MEALPSLDQKSGPAFAQDSRLLLSLIWLVSSSMIPNSLYADTGLNLGLSAIEEGDERFRPALSLEAQWNDMWWTQLQTFGRRQAPVAQTSYLLGVGRSYGVFSSKALLARVGLALASESTAIERSTGGKASSTNTNVGLYLGLSWRSSSRVYFQVDWGSAVFPAGISLIFLATARKQNVTAGVGWRL